MSESIINSTKGVSQKRNFHSLADLDENFEEKILFKRQKNAFECNFLLFFEV